MWLPAPRHAYVALLSRPVLFRIDHHKASLASRQQVACSIANLTFMIQLTAITARDKSLDDDFLVHADRAEILDAQVGGNGVFSVKSGCLAHHFIEQQGDNATVNETRSSLIFVAETKVADDTLTFCLGVGKVLCC